MQNAQQNLSRRNGVIVAAATMPGPKTKERQELKQIFEEAYERCRTAPMEGVSFTLEQFHSALEKYDFNSELGTKVGEVFIIISFWKLQFLFWNEMSKCEHEFQNIV